MLNIFRTVDVNQHIVGTDFRETLIQDILYKICCSYFQIPPKDFATNRKEEVVILSETSKKEYPKSVIELLRLEGKIFLQGVCYLINNIPIFI